MKKALKRFLATIFTVILIVSSIGNHTIKAYAAEEALVAEMEALAEAQEEEQIAAAQAAEDAEAERIAAEQAAQEAAEAERIAAEEAAAAEEEAAVNNVTEEVNDDTPGASEGSFDDESNTDEDVTETETDGDEAEAENPEAEAEEEEEEEEEEYPAQSWTAETPDVYVSASVEEGVFPEGTTMQVVPVSKQLAMDAAQDMVDENTEVVDAVAVDITFHNKDGEEIQPNGAVNVSLTPKKKLKGEEHDAITIDNSGEASVVETADADANGTDIVTDHFTVYGVIGTEEGGYDDSVTTYARHTYEFHAGVPTADPKTWPVVDAKTVRDGDTLSLPAEPAGDAKHAFLGWFQADENGNLTETQVTGGEITISQEGQAEGERPEDRTIQVYAKFSTKYQVTLYTDDTKKTVYETHLLDAGESFNELPQKEDDDFDLQIADGCDFTGWKVAGRLTKRTRQTWNWYPFLRT